MSGRFSQAAGWVAAAAFVFVPALGMRLANEEIHAGARSQDPLAQEQRNQSAMAVILGDFRTNLGDMLFVKTETYLDSGIRYEPHIDLASLETSGEEPGQGSDSSTNSLERFESRVAPANIHTAETCTDPSHNHEHDHAADHETSVTTAHNSEDEDKHLVETIIPRPEKDFRGFVGRLQREVKPWRDPREPHQHTAGTELLPWYRLATLGDPHNVRSYMIGAWWLKTMRTPEQLAEAEKFVREGIKNNPTAFQMPLMLGYVLRARKDDAAALGAFKEAAELALKARPPGGEESARWTTYNEEDAGAACTLAVLLTRELVGPQEALDLGTRYHNAQQNLPGLEISLRRLRETVASQDAPTTSTAIENQP